MKKLTAALLAALLIAAALSGCGQENEPSVSSSAATEIEAQTWRLTYSAGKDSVCAKTAEKFAELVFQATNGAIQVECVSESADPEHPDAGIRALINGDTDLALYTSMDYANLDPRFDVVSLPFLFDSEDDACEKLDGDGGDALRSVLEEYNLRCMGIGSDGFRCPTNSRRAIESPEDMRGLRLRVADDRMTERAYQLWGAEAATADWPMVFTALQTGTFDGQENVLSVANAASIQDIQKYVTCWNGLYESLFFCINRDLYESFSDDLRAVADECGAEAVAWQRQAQREEEQSILAAWGSARLTVTELTQAQAQAFRDAAQPCYDEFAREVSEELLDAFDGIRN